MEILYVKDNRVLCSKEFSKFAEVDFSTGKWKSYRVSPGGKENGLAL